MAGCSSRLKLVYLSLFIVIGISFLWNNSRIYTFKYKWSSWTASFIRENVSGTSPIRDYFLADYIHSSTFNTEPLPLNKTTTHWIVVTTGRSPSQETEKLGKIKGWQLLVVGNSQTPNNWTCPGSIFIGIDQQKTLGFRVTSHLPTSSYARKLIGYMYAIQQGAKFIYDMDDDNHLTEGKINFNQEGITSGLIYDDLTDHIINPYAHFGQPSIWPRGFPLDRLDKPNNTTYKLCTFKTPAIQQGLVNGDPDVDAIFRLTRKTPNERYTNVIFDARAPPVTLPEGVFAPFNSQNTFFSYDAFWALFLPTSVAFRVTDIWRGYWAQRLLWLIGQRLSFFPPNAVRFRNSHDHQQNFRDENQLYSQTNSLVEFLKHWTCAAKTFFRCVSLLGRKMAEAAFWKNSDAELLDSWLSDLMTIGYREPKMKDVRDDCLNSEDDEKMHRVYFTPVRQNDQFQTSCLRDINRFCDNHFNIPSKKMTDSGQRIYPKNVFDDVLLIIVFNFPFYKNIQLLDALYNDHFPNIVYCGQTPSYAKLTSEIDQGPLPWRKRQITFVNITSAKGYFGYECAIRAMEIRYDVEGYLVLGDDVMFNFWHFQKNRNQNVAQVQFRSYRTVNRTSGPIDWSWWNQPVGKKSLEKAFDKLEILAEKNSDTLQKKMILKYLKARHEANLSMSVVSLCVSDMYYIPKSVSDIFSQVMKVFLKNEVFLEIAVPSTLIALNPKLSENGFEGKSIWNEIERNNPMQFYNSTTHFVHPVKFSQLFKDKKTRKEYCQKYVKQLVENW